jgi:osmotically-inducible protein OsmY
MGNQTMFGQNRISDGDLLKSVTQNLSRTGTGSQSKIIARVSGGTVTLAGTLQYENQRVQLVKAANRAAGVRQVIDQMQLAPKKKPQ